VPPLPDLLDRYYGCRPTDSVLNAMRTGAKVEIPMTEAVVTFASVLAGRDYRRTGRTLDRLGWADLSREEILTTITG